MEIRVLQYFVTIAEEKSISKAAQKRHVTQPTLSRQIKELEEELSTKLFYRGSREVTLTEDGHYLYNRALEILSLVDKTSSNLMEKGPVSGTVTIGAAEGRSLKSVFAVAKDIQATYPRIQFNVNSANADDILEKLNAGILDFGIVARNVDKNIYDQLLLPTQEYWGVLLPKNHELANHSSLNWDDLAPYPILLPNQSESKTFFNQKFPNKIQIPATFNLIFNASLMVEAGMGLAITWSDLVATDSKESPLTFIPLEGDLPPIQLSLIWKKHSQQSRADQVFLEALKDAFGQ
ncbi:LysR family transcriptional regulator [Streptococcus orisasini]